MQPPELKHSLHFDLRAARKKQRLTQADLATKSGLSISAIRLLERGHGNLSSLLKMVEALDLVLEGGSLPAANTIGHRIAALRKRREHVQREFAAMVGISHPTLILLERHNRGRMETLERILVRLGAGAKLVEKNERTTFFSAAGNSSVQSRMDYAEMAPGRPVLGFRHVRSRPVFARERSVCENPFHNRR